MFLLSFLSSYVCYVLTVSPLSIVFFLFFSSHLLFSVLLFLSFFICLPVSFFCHLYHCLFLTTPFSVFKAFLFSPRYFFPFVFIPTSSFSLSFYSCSLTFFLFSFLNHLVLKTFLHFFIVYLHRHLVFLIFNFFFINLFFLLCRLFFFIIFAKAVFKLSSISSFLKNMRNIYLFIWEIYIYLYFF